MSEHKIELADPVTCSKCGEGHLLAFLVPHFEGEGTYAFQKPFSYYEIIYRCSRNAPHSGLFDCHYEERL
jgi:hypothetical protein